MQESDPIRPKHRDVSGEERATLVDFVKLDQQGCTESCDEFFGRLLEFYDLK
jgi:hypothetical protein